MAVGFVDAVGFSSFTAAHGDEAAVQIAERLEATTVELDGFGVRTVKHLGDGLLAVCEHPAKLVTGIQHVLAFDSSESTSLRLRAGVTVGSVIVRRGDVHGVVVNLAARLCDLAPPGTCWMTTDVLAALPVAVGARLLGRVTVRGFPTTVDVAELGCTTAPAGRVEDPVCRMLIDPNLAAASREDATGTRWWFCSTACHAMHPT